MITIYNIYIKLKIKKCEEGVIIDTLYII